MTKKPSILMVDGYSLTFRGFHALPVLTTADGTYTNAIHGFFSMLLKALGDYRPDGLCVMLDVHAPTFRHSIFEDYKGTRKPMPEELRPQLPLLRQLLAAMQIKTFEMEGYEADDLLGTAARLAGEAGYDAYILTGDRDSLQLVGGSTRVILTKTGISESLLLDAEGVLEHYGYTPEMVPDMKGLMGDSSDNIPGIAGVGEKTALKLMTEYGTLDNVLLSADSIKGKLGEKIRAGKEIALMSRDLGTIRVNAPIQPDFASLTWQNMDQGLEMLRSLELNQIARGVEKLLRGETAPAPAPETRSTAAAKRAAGGKTSAPSGAAVMQKEKDLPALPHPASDKVFTDEAALHGAALDFCASDPAFAVLCTGETEFTLLTPDMTLWRMPLLVDLMGGGLYDDAIFRALSPILESVPLILHGAKQLFHLLSRFSLPLPTVLRDTMLGAYLLHTAQKDYSLRTCFLTEFAMDADDMPPLDAAALYGMKLRQDVRLKARELESLLSDIEQPLSKVLFQMEREGFHVDLSTLDQLSELFTARIEESRAAVYQLTGVSDFNLNSPKQLGEVLFDKLGLPAKKKNKSGSYSTDAEVLESLIPYHACIEPLLTYRKLSKLQSTYIDGLRKLLQKDGKVRTTFDQTATVTGRISSLEPNLQNIPIRTEEGREIRRAFVAGEGNILLDADYSQIELRVLAHLSGDSNMCDAFNKNQDIHTRTAAEISGVAMEEVTPAMRRAAKATNFGIVYGISGFGLAKNAGISRKEADSFIARYFERYPDVRRFMDDCIKTGYETGFAKTMFGRRRELFELQSPNRNVRSFGERAAMNTPVQGSAADIIKLAMVKVAQRLEKEYPAARLILQVHDELVIECPIPLADEVSQMLQSVMENVVELKVPLVAEVSRGKDWEQAH